MNTTVKYYEDLNYDELMLVVGGDAETGAGILSDIAGAIESLVNAGCQVYAGLKQAAYDAGRASVYKKYL